jgi:DNA-binding YbaB/EbfC family protein
LADQPSYSPLQKRVVNELVRLDAELARKSATATAGGGLVRVRVDGHQVLRELVIDPEVFAGRDPDLLADLIMSAIAEAQRRVAAIAEESQDTALNLDAAAG